MLFLLTDPPPKLKLGKVHCTLRILFYLSLSSNQLQFRKENAKILSKNSTTQENIKISRQNLLFLMKNTKIFHSSASYWWKSTESSCKENARLLSKTSTTRENI